MILIKPCSPMLRRPRRHRLSAIPVAALMLFLAGCGTTSPFGVNLGDYEAAPRDLIGVASVGDYHIVRPLRAGYLGRAERERLRSFVSDVAQNRPESLRVALRGPAAPAQLRAVTVALIADGVDPKSISIADWHVGPPAPRGGVVVIVERAIAIQPNCPLVDHISAPADNQTNPDFGCANARNFAAMVADPHHLVAGASSIYSDGERAAGNVANYRAKKLQPWSEQEQALPPNNESFSVVPSH
jgi:pilus biogenesis lipoprotein CpaD